MIALLAVNLLLIILLILEGTLTTLPLVMLYLLCMTILKRDAGVFVVAFFAGLCLDLLAVRTLGVTSLFFILFLFLLLLYQRKYEIYSYPFIVASSFLGSAGFLFLFGYGNIFLQSVISAIVTVIAFALIRWKFKTQGSHIV
jgi:cell shape-determining protein MreD